MAATYPATTLNEAVDLLEQDVNKFHDVLNGDATTTVAIDSGSVPSVNKALADMAAYKVPVAWANGVQETDILQPRTYSGNAYVPLTAPVTMGAAPDGNWKLYSYTVTAVDVITLDQDSGDGAAVIVNNSGVTQPYTGMATGITANTCGYLDNRDNTDGGLIVAGLSGGTDEIGLYLIGGGEGTDTSDTGVAQIHLRSGTGNGTVLGNMADTDNMVTIANNVATKVAIKGNGDIKTQGGVYAIGEISGLASDERLKENVQPVEDALSKVQQLNGVTFNFNERAKEYGLPEEGQLGLIAQDVEKVIPEAVMPFAFDPEYKNVKYDKLVALLVEAVKELSQQVEELKNGNTK